jgi:hypothetical protein
MAIKVPTKESRRLNEERNATILEILKEDAKEELTNSEPRLLGSRRKVLELLLQQNELIHVDFWQPRQQILNKLMSLGLIEDRFIEPELDPFTGKLFNHALVNTEKKLRNGRIADVLRLIEDDLCDSPLFEELMPELGDYDNCFVKHGDVWFVKFNEKVAYIRDSKRLRYLIQLLIYQGKSLHVIKMVEIVSSINVSEKVDGRVLEAEGLESKGLDFNEFEDYIDQHGDNRGNQEKKRWMRGITETITDFWSEYRYANSEKAKTETKDQLDNLIKKLKKNYPNISITITDMGPKFYINKDIGKSVKKATDLVRNSVKNCLQKDIHSKLPKLADHLNQHITYGSSPTYPSKEISGKTWYIDY